MGAARLRERTPGAAGKPSPKRATSRFQQTRNRVSYPWPGRRSDNTDWKPEPVAGTKAWDELGVEVKCQSSSEIAGSPRNAFRGSPGARMPEVGHWMGKGARAYQPQPNHQCRHTIPRSETVRDKPHRREGKSPDRRLRPPSADSVEKDVRFPRQPGGWLRSSHP